MKDSLRYTFNIQFNDYRVSIQVPLNLRMNQLYDIIKAKFFNSSSDAFNQISIFYKQTNKSIAIEEDESLNDFIFNKNTLMYLNHNKDNQLSSSSISGSQFSKENEGDNSFSKWNKEIEKPINKEKITNKDHSYSQNNHNEQINPFKLHTTDGNKLAFNQTKENTTAYSATNIGNKSTNEIIDKQIVLEFIDKISLSMNIFNKNQLEEINSFKTALFGRKKKKSRRIVDIHEGINCKQCSVEIVGMRYQCRFCPKINYCENCYNMIKQNKKNQLHPHSTYIAIENTSVYDFERHTYWKENYKVDFQQDIFFEKNKNKNNSYNKFNMSFAVKNILVHQKDISLEYLPSNHNRTISTKDTTKTNTYLNYTIETNKLNISPLIQNDSNDNVIKLNRNLQKFDDNTSIVKEMFVPKQLREKVYNNLNPQPLIEESKPQINEIPRKPNFFITLNNGVYNYETKLERLEKYKGIEIKFESNLKVIAILPENGFSNIFPSQTEVNSEKKIITFVFTKLHKIDPNKEKLEYYFKVAPTPVYPADKLPRFKITLLRSQN